MAKRKTRVEQPPRKGAPVPRQVAPSDQQCSRRKFPGAKLVHYAGIAIWTRLPRDRQAEAALVQAVNSELKRKQQDRKNGDKRTLSMGSNVHIQVKREASVGTSEDKQSAVTSASESGGYDSEDDEDDSDSEIGEASERGSHSRSNTASGSENERNSDSASGSIVSEESTAFGQLRPQKRRLDETPKRIWKKARLDVQAHEKTQIRGKEIETTDFSLTTRQQSSDDSVPSETNSDSEAKSRSDSRSGSDDETEQSSSKNSDDSDESKSAYARRRKEVLVFYGLQDCERPFPDWFYRVSTLR